MNRHETDFLYRRRPPYVRAFPRSATSFIRCEQTCPDMTMIPDQMRALRAWWLTKPSFVRYVSHAYDLGGYDILPNVSIDLDDRGLEFVRTFNLRDRRNGTEFRLINLDDLLHQLTDYEVR